VFTIGCLLQTSQIYSRSLLLKNKIKACILKMSHVATGVEKQKGGVYVIKPEACKNVVRRLCSNKKDADIIRSLDFKQATSVEMSVLREVSLFEDVTDRYASDF
jgi:hypothetical protein